MANQNVEVYTEQEGICVLKEYREAKEERTDANGRVWPATKEKYIVKVLSCTSRYFSNDTGMSKPMLLDYEVDNETYNKIKFNVNQFMRAKVGFTVKTYDKDIICKTEYFALI